MKQLFFAFTTLTLFACCSTSRIEKPCCDVTDANDLPFDINSITTTSQLLDSLNAVPVVGHVEY